MKKRTIIMVILMFITGLSLLLYPTVSNYFKSLSYRRTIGDYVSSVDPMDSGSTRQMLSDAQAYNERLAERGGSVLFLPEKELAEYNSLLDIDGTGIMGYVSIPRIDVSLPIYHGTDDGVLQNGVGHLEGSSLPVGGADTHAVLSAHTGLPSAKLFTNIDQLTAGDTFTVRVLKETLTYEVDQILVVLPTETDALEIEPGQDYCTLMTCTPYGVNSHRLLVRGRRLPTPAPEETPEQDPGPNHGSLLLLIPLAAALAVLAALLTVLRRKRPGRGQSA